jgi:hypothetical protein
MSFSDAARNAMLDHLGTIALYASLHSADPGTTGANELTGGSPAYARKPITWNPAATSNLDSDAEPLFDVPPGTTVSHWGLWSVVSDGTFYAGDDTSTVEVFTGQGTYALTDLDLSLTG